jgi:hypothetical protein
MRLVLLLVTVGAICASTSMASAQAIDWQKVDDAAGRKPAAVAGDAHRYGFPRTDLNVRWTASPLSPPWRWAVGWHSNPCMVTQWSWVTSCYWKPRLPRL